MKLGDNIANLSLSLMHASMLNAFSLCCLIICNAFINVVQRNSLPIGFACFLSLQQNSCVGKCNELSEMIVFSFPCNTMQEIGPEPVPPCLTRPLANLRMVSIDMEDYIEWGLVDLSDIYQEIAVLKCLLQSTPALQTMEFQFPESANGEENELAEIFLLQLSEVSRASAQAKICATIT